MFVRDGDVGGWQHVGGRTDWTQEVGGSGFRAVSAMTQLGGNSGGGRGFAWIMDSWIDCSATINPPFRRATKRTASSPDEQALKRIGTAADCLAETLEQAHQEAFAKLTPNNASWCCNS